MDNTLAGFAFTATQHHDLRMFRAPGVYVLARRHQGGRQVLFVGHAPEISTAYGGAAWRAALRLDMNEALILLGARERLDRLQVAAIIVRAYAPVLNPRPKGADAISGSEAALGLRSL